MNDCPKCGSNDTYIFFEEEIPCSHCDEINTVIYHACNHCATLWKSVDGEILEDSLLSDEQLEDMLGDSIDNFEGHLLEVEGTMSEIVHRCLRCRTISFEVAPSVYHCPECSFEWEVFDA
jgi:hypothetical protein